MSFSLRCHWLKTSALACALGFGVLLSLACPLEASAQNKTVPAKALQGKVKIVSSFPDYRVKIVNSFPDLRVKTVSSFPNSPGKWQFVESFPDFTVQFVDSFPDFTIEFVESFPGPTP